jgi:hypothetical protein
MHRISQRAVATEAFYERFLAYFTSEGEGTDIRNRLTWLHHLLLLPSTNEALVLAVQATTSAYCTVESADTAPTRHYRNLHGEALRMHSHFLSLLADTVT